MLRAGNPGESVDESSIEDAKAEEDLYVTVGLRPGSPPGRDGVHAFRVHLDASRIDDEPKEFDFLLVELTVLGVRIQLELSQAFQNQG